MARNALNTLFDKHLRIYLEIYPNLDITPDPHNAPAFTIVRINVGTQLSYPKENLPVH